LSPEKNSENKIKFADSLEEKIYNAIIYESLNINEIAKKISIDIQTVLFKLSMMELSGLTKI